VDVVNTSFMDHLVSISPTFYARLFRMKVLREAFLYLHIRFELLLVKENSRKCAYKMLVKLTNKGLNTAVLQMYRRNLLSCIPSKQHLAVKVKKMMRKNNSIEWSLG
jgi:hypothetical protein